MILYLHGFRSSPSSAKAQIMQQALQARGQMARWHCPQLPIDPQQAIDRCVALIQQHHQPGQPLALIGSSLGGFYATCLAERWPEARTVVLNPVVHAARDLAKYQGTLTNFHTGEPFDFGPADVQALARLECTQISRPERYFLVAATGDEILDWREMAAHYAAAKQKIIDGSDHGLSDFPKHLPDILAFLDLPLEPVSADQPNHQPTR